MEAAIGVTSNTKLQVVIFSDIAVNPIVNYQTRINGILKVPYSVPINSTRISILGAANYFYYDFYGDGNDVAELLTASIGMLTAGIQRGDCFVRVGLTIGGVDGVRTDPYRILFSDYVTSNSFLSYPGTSLTSSLDGRGILVRNVVTNPGAGNNAQYSVGANFYERFLCAGCTLTTDATVITRTFTMIFTPITSTILRLESVFAHTASLSKSYLTNPVTYGFTELAGITTTKNVLGVPANFLMAPGGSVVFDTINLQAGDVLSSLNVQVERWIKG